MYPRIRNLREDSDLTQTEIAKLLGISQTGYSKYETGENDISTSILLSLARLHYLLGLTDSRKPYPRAKKQAGDERLGG